MSQYKSAIRAQPPQGLPDNSKYRAQARQLQELFPNWSNDDLQSLLGEVGGDVQVAATRISDGNVELWGEVSRKKDKKAPTPTHNSKAPFSGRGDSRGGRGAEVDGGGLGRGGAATRGRGGPSRGGANGHVSHTDIARPSSTAPPNGSVPASLESKATESDAPATAAVVTSHDQQNGLTASNSGYTDASSQPETSTLATSISGNGSAWGADNDVNGSIPIAHLPASKQASKTPATSKMSWAQIARPHEKPTPPVAQAPQPPSGPVPSSLPVTETEPQPETSPNGWEEPTTVEAPTWDDEPQGKQGSAVETWPPAADSVVEAPIPEPPTTSTLEETEEPSAPASAEPPVEPKVEEKAISPAPIPAQPISVLPAQVVATPSPKLGSRPAVVSHRNSARYKVTDQPVTMPLSFGSGLEKVGMQFGSLSLSGDGSVEPTPAESEVPAPSSEPASPPMSQAKAQLEPAVAAPPPPPATAPASSNSLASVFQQQQSAPQQPSTQPQTLPQTAIPHHSIPSSVSQPIQSTQTSSSHAAVAASPLQQFAQQQQAVSQQQQALASNGHQQQQHQLPHHQQPQHQSQHLQHLPQQVQQSHAAHHSYAQHGLPTHIDPSQQMQSPAQQQPLQSATHSNYFRQTEAPSAAPYFHTPTPPAAQSQDSPYGSFGQLGGQGQHQQGSHHGAFNSSDYGYSENQRGFYESYAQQVGFGTRNPTGLDDGKGLPSAQQATTTALPPSSAQAAQQHSSQTSGQPHSSGGQGPQQTYPPPVPYYYAHAYPQNQYYGTPYNSGYVAQPPFVKYPAVFQPGPPGPGSASSPATKQSGGNVGVGVQPQSNPYNQGLYQQTGYDDYQPHPHHSQHQHTHSLGLNQGAVGVGSGEYGKQLYGGAAQGGMQGFMGLGGQTGGGGVGPASNAGPRGAGSPETAYKPYAAKDVGVSAGRGAPVQGGQGQSQPLNQGQGQTAQGGPQAQGFYGANRFGGGVGGAGAGGVGSGAGGGAGGPQQGAHHQQAGPQGHLGYPQGGSEPNFYGYQPRQQQGYWQ